jgi:hypothetical protein
VLPREAREGPAPKYSGCEAVLVGWKPDEIYSKSPRLRTLILTREFELHFRVGLEHELNLNLNLEQLSATDILALATMKNAAKCDT